MKSIQTVGLIGSLTVLLGCFLPVVNIPGSAELNYMFSRGNSIGGGILVFLALLGMLGALRKSGVMLLVAGALGAVIFGFTLLNMMGLLDAIADIEEFLLNETKFKSGTLVIALGLVTMGGSSIIPTDRTPVKAHSGKSRKPKLRQDNIHREQKRRQHRSVRKRSSSKSSIFGSGKRQSRRRSSKG